MARVPMVTRSMHTTIATILAVNVEQEKTEQIEVVLPRTYKDEKSILKAAMNHVDDNLKLVHVINTRIETNLYGMSEDDFIANAQLLPARTKAEIED